VKNKRTKEFRKLFEKLPHDVQNQAISAYRLFKENPRHPGLRFQCIDPQESIWSVRIGLHYRAVGVWVGDTIIWFFIGSHADYDHLLDEQ
jgi:hypothetical protein